MLPMHSAILPLLTRSRQQRSQRNEAGKVSRHHAVRFGRHSFTHQFAPDLPQPIATKFNAGRIGEVIRLLGSDLHHGCAIRGY